MFLFTTIIIISAFLIYKLFIENHDGRPPGEWRLMVPFIHKENELQKFLTIQKTKHGNIFSLKFRGRISIFLADIENIQQVQEKLEFQSIWADKLSRKNLYASFGIQYMPEPMFQRTKQFNVKPIEDFNLHPFINELNEKIIRRFILEVIEDVENESLTHSSVMKLLEHSICKVLLLLTTGKHVEPDSVEHEKIANIVSRSYKIIKRNQLKNGIYLWLIERSPENLQKMLLQFDDLDKNWKEFEVKILEYVQESRREQNENSATSHFANMYLSGLERTKLARDSRLYKDYVSRLVSCLYNFFLKELEVISTQVFQVFHFLKQQREAQTKIQKEIDKVCGESNLSMKDKITLPWFKAFLLEFERLYPFTPNEMIGIIKEDGMHNGYNFPKGSIVYGSSYLCHLEEKMFPNPTQFYPDRFLDHDGNLDERVTGYVPLALGKTPLGTLAESLLFFIVGSVLQQYRISTPHTKAPGKSDSLIVLRKRMKNECTLCSD